MSAPSLHIRGVKIHRHLLKYMFPQVINGEIDTNKFLNASRNFIQIIDKFGKVFIPLKYDMQNNIEKLSQRYNANKSSHASLQSLILSENNTEKNSVTAEALLWLTRELRMIQVLFDKIVTAERNNNYTEDLTSKINESYDEVMFGHSEWMAQQLFSLLAKSIPTCSQILLSLGENTPDAKVTTINTLDIISKQMQSNLIILNKFLYVNDIGQVF
ncbi:putative protein PLEKHA9 isoform X1 [Fopius arisanus]|uniref:Glycolipid transfer protein domain-containing protein n=2 Tax=Fopius arisanus TaxID=64838 RepID=A0A9R1T0E9_9HYME|nr:PREDICTED: putative protein PLEKHA9 isoform X1 [Fopius arisanus]